MSLAPGGGADWIVGFLKFISDLQQTVKGVEDVITDLSEMMGQISAFTQDPMGFLAGHMRVLAYGLTEVLTPMMLELTQPDYSAEWFRSVYALSFGVGVVVYVSLLVWTLFKVSQGSAAPTEAFEAMTSRFAHFVIGSMLGPAIGSLVLTLTHAVSTQIISVMVGGGIQEAISTLGEMTKNEDALSVVAGAIGALLLYTVYVFGLVMVNFALLLSLAAAYFGGALLPLALAWTADPKRVGVAKAAVLTLLGIFAAKPVLFFLMGIVFMMAGGSLGGMDAENPVQPFVNYALVGIMLVVVGLAPFSLFKMAKHLMPTSAGQSGPGAKGLPAPSAGMPRFSSPAARSSFDGMQRRQALPTAPSGPETTQGPPAGRHAQAQTAGSPAPGPVERAAQAQRSEAGAASMSQASAGAGTAKPAAAAAETVAQKGQAGAAGKVATAGRGAAAGAGAAAGVGGVAAMAAVAAAKATSKSANGMLDEMGNDPRGDER